jgi:hypothetical protein
MHGASVGTFLNLEDAVLRNPSGPALFLNQSKIGDHLSINGISAEGRGTAANVSVLRSVVGGQVNATGLQSINEDGTAFAADYTRIGHDFTIDSVCLRGRSDEGVLRLYETKIDGRLTWKSEHIENALGRRFEVVLDGLTYRGLPSGVAPLEWLRMLRTRMPAYVPQPYRMLVAAAQAAGDDHLARRVLIGQRKEQLASGSVGTAERLWGWVTGLTLGYGYRPWKALIALLLVIVASALMHWLLGLGGLVHLNPDKTAASCTLTERIVLGVDLAIPLVTTPTAASCTPNASWRGQWLTYGALSFQILGWAFATLFVAGFTAAVRRP